MVKKAATEGQLADQTARAKASRTFKKRKDCVKKKTMELATLCGTKACVVCFSPSGELETWPENPSDVKAVIKMHQDYAKNGRRHKKTADNAAAVETSSTEEFSSWEDQWLGSLSKVELANFLEMVNLKLQGVDARIQFLEKTMYQQNWVAMNETQEMDEAAMMMGNAWPPLQTLGYEATAAEPAEFGYSCDGPMFAIGASTWALLNSYEDVRSSIPAWW